MADRSFASHAPVSPSDIEFEDLEVQRTIESTRADPLNESPWRDNPDPESPDSDDISSISEKSDGRHWMAERE